MTSTGSHDISIRDRKLIEVSGVSSVESFDAREFALTTVAGPLHVHGLNLHMKHLDLEQGIVIIEGALTSLNYAEHQGKKRRMVTKLLR